MNIEAENLDSLRKLIRELQEENNYLKEKLKKANIAYPESGIFEDKMEDTAEYDPDQGERIIDKFITEDMANQYFAMFWGRTDVYAKRGRNGGYFPQCDNRWNDRMCPKQRGEKIRCEDCENTKWTKLTAKKIVEHLVGYKEDGSDVLGVYPLLPDGTCRFIVFDFDNHEKGAEATDFANITEEWHKEVDALRLMCEKNGIIPLVERSRSGRVIDTNETKNDINGAYNLISDNQVRSEMIVEDTRSAIITGRTPVILTRYKEQAKKLYDNLTNAADYVFLLYGDNSDKENSEIRRKLKEIPDDKSLVLIATGQKIGEGFDFPRLDTLMLAAPVSFEGRLEQYVGRLHRDYEGKKDVVVYDYIDSHIRVFENMYAKRLRTYKRLGYSLISNAVLEKQTANAIYDSGNYSDVFEQDLVQAEKRIIISSPQITQDKIDRMIYVTKQRVEAGCKITVITTNPEGAVYGSSAHYYSMIKQMEEAGVHVIVKDEVDEHFALIDAELVWHGGMNLLGKEDVWDNLMRIKSAVVAEELLELSLRSRTD